MTECRHCTTHPNPWERQLQVSGNRWAVGGKEEPTPPLQVPSETPEYGLSPLLWVRGGKQRGSPALRPSSKTGRLDTSPKCLGWERLLCLPTSPGRLGQREGPPRGPTAPLMVVCGAESSLRRKGIGRAGVLGKAEGRAAVGGKARSRPRACVPSGGLHSVFPAKERLLVSGPHPWRQGAPAP